MPLLRLFIMLPPRSLAILVLLAWLRPRRRGSPSPDRLGRRHGGRRERPPLAGARVELLRATGVVLQIGRRGAETELEQLVAAGSQIPRLSAADGRFRIPISQPILVRAAGPPERLHRPGAARHREPAAGGQIALGTLRLLRVRRSTAGWSTPRGAGGGGAGLGPLRGGPPAQRRLTDPQAWAAASRRGSDRRERPLLDPPLRAGILEVCGKGSPPPGSSPSPGAEPDRPHRATPSRRLSGRVIDGQGLPVAQAKVLLTAHGRDPCGCS